MYSILIKVPSGDKYSFYLNNDGEIYTTNDLTDLGEKVGELLNSYTLDRIVPIKNCVVTRNITIEESIG